MNLGNTGKKISYNPRKHELWYLFDSEWKLAPLNSEEFERVYEVYQCYKSDKSNESVWSALLSSCISYLNSSGVLKFSDTENLKRILNHLVQFFSEFNFSPSLRFTNTLVRCASRGQGKQYVYDYFKLQDSVCSEEVKCKSDSVEFDEILEGLASISPSRQINTRLKVYYGPQGTGKTTQAIQEAEDCIVCHSAMLPSDLMEDFKFNEGKAAFEPSALWRAMENGTQIVLDEINLLPFESLRFLQSLLDGKESFDYKGHIVKIKTGFKVIGTMNLIVNGMTYPLPEPLVDRCEEIREFSITPDLLLEAF